MPSATTTEFGAQPTHARVVDDGNIVTPGGVTSGLDLGNAHVEQVSVAPAHTRRGIGRQLMSHLEEWGRGNHRPATTLTTSRDVPWNGPCYETLGYRGLAGAGIGSELAAAMEHEASLPGIDASGRCAMIKRNGNAS